MRPPKPWYRTNRDAWFVQHNGKQVLLAHGKANKSEAMAAFHKLMLLDPGAAPKAESFSVAVLCDLFLDFSQKHHSPDSFANNKFFLQSFCRRYGRSPATEVKPFHVNSWLDVHKSWRGVRGKATAVIKRVFSWAEQQGLIGANPIRSIRTPQSKPRDRILTAAERTLLVESSRDAAFRNFLKALLGTGCRPSEVASVVAADVNFELGIWILKRHKTVKKTGKPRIVYLSPEMLELTKQQVTRFPDGVLFPNSRGRPFTRNAWRCRFRRLREKHPSLAGVVCYTCRHDYATTALVNGVGIAQVAQLLGHTDTSMVSKVYGHLAQNVAHMRQAAKQVRKGECD